MLEKNAAVDRLPASSIDAARVAILMGTKNGGAFLGPQLESIAVQTHRNWILIVSDDGSTDDTTSIVERFAGDHPQRVTIVNGPQRGVTANFLSLAADPAIEADYFAFSDQDDIWHPDKLRRALEFLAAVPAEMPAMCCGRTELMSAEGRYYGLSPLFSRQPSFRNALVQSLGGGNTMMFNKSAKKLLERAGRLSVVLHDWWVYQLVSAAGGIIRYDPQPMLKYRQHRNSLIGSNLGWRARLVRIRMTLSGRFHEWNAMNMAALEGLPGDLIRPENRAVVSLFGQAAIASLPMRLVYLRRSGVYRQTLLGNVGLIAAAIVKRI